MTQGAAPTALYFEAQITLKVWLPSCYRACTGIGFCRHNKNILKNNEPIPFFTRLKVERGRNNIGSIKKRVNLDGIHSLDISINEERKTVITELITLDDEPVMIYAEKFDNHCDYLKKGIRRGIEFINADRHSKFEANKFI